MGDSKINHTFLRQRSIEYVLHTGFQVLYCSGEEGKDSLCGLRRTYRPVKQQQYSMMCYYRDKHKMLRLHKG